MNDKEKAVLTSIGLQEYSDKNTKKYLLTDFSSKENSQPDPEVEAFLKKHLNDKQYEAVISKGPVLVVAGAGTGKTRVLVYRVYYLIKSGTEPPRILLLTFTKKAATEMLDRVSTLLADNSGRQVSGGTFHAFCVNTIKQYGNLLDLPVKFTVLDNPDSEDVIDKIRTDLGYNVQEKNFPYKARIFEIISFARNNMVPISYVIEAKYSALEPYIPDIEKIAKHYRDYKKANALFDFDDLVEVLVEKLKENPRFQRKISRKYKYVMVDEFQDTNVLQMELVRLIAPAGNNVMVVGDEMQAIYAFRGANYQNIIDFPSLFTGCKIIKLEQNYRSQPALLDFTNQITIYAKTGYEKKLWSDKEAECKPFVVKFDEPEDEAVFVADSIRKLLETNVTTEEIAVLVRVSHTSICIQLELGKRGIPYVIIGGKKFTERKHIKDVMAYLRIAHNMKDPVAWHRVLKLIPGVGPKTAEKILLFLDDDGLLENIQEKRQNEKIHELGRVIRDISDEAVSLPDKIERIKQHYYPILEMIDKDPEIRKTDIDYFQQFSGEYESLEKFLTDFVLNPPAKELVKATGPVIDETEEKPLTISTIHSAKGLEWHTVFIPHALEGIMPSSKAVSEEELEEERRMFYVGCTRAKEHLFITYPSYLPGYNACSHFKSRFLEEIDSAFYNSLNELD